MVLSTYSQALGISNDTLLSSWSEALRWPIVRESSGLTLNCRAFEQRHLSKLTKTHPGNGVKI